MICDKTCKLYETCDYRKMSHMDNSPCSVRDYYDELDTKPNTQNFIELFSVYKNEKLHSTLHKLEIILDIVIVALIIYVIESR